ncbi:MAG TPA: maleylpyruvate isomerase family mycothiol-dependent enzyme [Streptosporangiaceae bacterium]|nr:maleylpyruvate isomerase family mycothiol-dependent enzyme [Streptosporangiaceae bacterium]
MTDLATTRGALEQCYDAVEGLCTRMTVQDWQVQSLCPAWTARGVVQHLTMMEQAMTGWVPANTEELPHFERVARADEEMGHLDDGAFAGLVSETFAGRRRDLAALTQEDMDRPSWTPVGVKTFGRFLEIRTFDFWVHARDITTPLGWPTDDTGPAAEIALAEVEGSLGYIVGKRVALPDGSGIVFHLTGPIKRDLAVVVDGRARVVDHLDNPDVEVTTDLLTFMQLACGRIDPQEQIDAGKITWTGNDELGDRAARNLRFTI